MTDDVHRFATRFAAHHRRYSNMGGGRFEFAPGDDDDPEEDIGPPPRRRRRRRGLLRRGVVLLTLFGLGWAVYDDPSRVGRWWSTASETLGPVVKRVVDKALEPSPTTASPETTSNSNVSVASTTPTLRLTAAPTEVTRREPEVARATVQVKPDAAKPEQTSPDAPKIIAKLPPVRGVVKPSSDAPKKITDKDKYVARAQAVGLHPRLSLVVLSKLSKRDLGNARYAIRTALAKTADDATFTWPRKRKAKLAMFEVRFVPGAAKGCRRYVVTIEKDRWLTTALPVENCKVKRVQLSRAAKR